MDRSSKKKNTDTSFYSKEEVSGEALKYLYGTSRKAEIDLSKQQNHKETTKVVLPSFEHIVRHIHTKVQTGVSDPNRQINKCFDGAIPFTMDVYVEVPLKTGLSSFKSSFCRL